MRTRIRTALTAALAAAAVAVGLMALPAAPASAAPAGFVYRSGTDFAVNGRAFRHVGVNTSRLIYQPQSQITLTLDRLRAAGVRHVRVYLPNDWEPGDKYWPHSIYNKLRYVLDQAAARGMYVTVVLGTSWFDVISTYAQPCCSQIAVYGDQQYYDSPRPAGYPNKLADRWIDWAFQLNFRDWAWSFASRLKDHKAVFAWEIMNELDVSNVYNGWLWDREVAFYRNLADLLKAADPNHMVTAGLASTRFMTDAQRDGIYGYSKIDYVTVHQYNNDPERTFADDAWRARNRWGKPLIVEEFGLDSRTYSFAAVQTYYTDKYNNWGADAVMVWDMQYGCVQASPPFYANPSWGNQGGKPGDPLFGPCEQNRIAQYESTWLSWARAFGTA